MGSETGMIQTIDFAPLDGITKIVFRQVWSQFFGGVDRYFIPFFSPTPHHLMTPRDLREVTISTTPISPRCLR